MNKSWLNCHPSATSAGVSPRLGALDGLLTADAHHAGRWPCLSLARTKEVGIDIHIVMYVMSSYSNTLNTKRHSFQVHSTLCFFEACSVLVRQHCKVVCCRRSNDRGSRRERERKPKKDKDSGGWPSFFHLGFWDFDDESCIKFPLPVIKTPLKAHGLSAFIRLTMDHHLKYVDFEWKPGTTHDNLKLPRLGVQHGTAHLWCLRIWSLAGVWFRGSSLRQDVTEVSAR